MLCLPLGKAVRPQVNPARVNLPQAMEKLRGGGFSGYLRFDGAPGSGVVVFRDGQLISAVFAGGGDVRLIAYDALSRIFEMSIEGDSRLNIYQLSAEVAMLLHALLQGSFLVQGEDLSCLDLAALLKRIADEKLSACVGVYAGDRVTLIFYQEGLALGFFPDGASTLQQSIDVDTSVAACEGARLDLVRIPSIDRIAAADLMAAVDLAPLWQQTRTRILGAELPGDKQG